MSAVRVSTSADIIKGLPRIGPVEIRGSDEVELGVDPEDALHDEVEGDAVRPAHGVGDDHGAVRAVHAGALDPGHLAPVGPEEPSIERN